MSAQDAVAQILLECEARCRTLPPAFEIVNGLLDKGYAIVPTSPTHAMERAYFTAPMPEFDAKASGRKRHKNNKAKMLARWNAMLAAARVMPREDRVELIRRLVGDPREGVNLNPHPKTGIG